jgi:hypothetical protein
MKFLVAFCVGVNSIAGQREFPADIGGEMRGWAMDRNGQFRPDRAAESPIDQTSLEALIAAPDQYLTYLCTPWGSGTRIGIDRDLDGTLNGDE